MALRYLRTRKTRTALTTLAILLGVAILFGMNTILPSMMQIFRQGMLAAAGEVDLVFSSVTDGPFPADRVEVVRQVEGVAEAAGSLRRNVLLPPSLVGTADPLQSVNSVTVVGVEPESADASGCIPPRRGASWNRAMATWWSSARGWPRNSPWMWAVP
jgi:putative ABC transport system permease protein